MDITSNEITANYEKPCDNERTDGETKQKTNYGHCYLEKGTVRPGTSRYVPLSPKSFPKMPERLCRFD